ncbi:MAG: hypothetical protein KY462_15395 [Actinobacteria bacterium]|nr:hypothetical protein [Actinomycetota bacterium]
MPKEESGTPTNDSLTRAAERLRDSAKWLIVSFGAVAAAVFAGVSVSDIGKLDFTTPGYRFSIALAAGTTAILGIAAALAKAMQLAGASTTSLQDLTRPTQRYEVALRKTREELAHDPALHPWDGNVAGFINEYRDAYEDFLDRVFAYAEDPNPSPDVTDLRKAQFRLQELRNVAGRLLGTTGFIRLQRSFRYARWIIAGWLLLAAAGSVAFAWAASPPDVELAELTTQPVVVAFHPDDGTLAAINRQTTDTCRARAEDLSAVVVLSSDKDRGTAEIITLPRAECRPIRATVPLAQVRQVQFGVGAP